MAGARQNDEREEDLEDAFSQKSGGADDDAEEDAGSDADEDDEGEGKEGKKKRKRAAKKEGEKKPRAKRVKKAAGAGEGKARSKGAKGGVGGVASSGGGASKGTLRKVAFTSKAKSSVPKVTTGISSTGESRTGSVAVKRKAGVNLLSVKKAQVK